MLQNVLPPFFPQHHSLNSEEFLLLSTDIKYSRLRPVLFYLDSACSFVIFMFENIISLFVDVILYRLDEN